MMVENYSQSDLAIGGAKGAPGTKGPSLLCETLSQQKYSGKKKKRKKKRSQYLLWRPDDGAKQDAIWPCQPQEGKKIKMVLEQFGQEDNRILYFLAQQ